MDAMIDGTQEVQQRLSIQQHTDTLLSDTAFNNKE
jgi:hypothetical protein